MPGCAPAEMALAFEGSARWLNHAAAIWDRPALWTHANRTTFMAHLLEGQARRARRRSRRRTDPVAWRKNRRCNQSER